MKLTLKHYQTGDWFAVTVEHGVYTEIKKLTVPSDEEGEWWAPGLMDVQVNGFGGIDFNCMPAGVEAWEQACHTLWAHGCTHFLATFITNVPEEEQRLWSAWEALRNRQPWNCVGYHLEGPFLNSQTGYHGAHRPEEIYVPEISWWLGAQQQLGGQVRLITCAPEQDLGRAKELLVWAQKENISVAAGHSALMGSALMEMIEAGLSAWTHLGNATPNPAPKFENVIFHALVHERLLASLIPDGHHIPPHAFRVMARVLSQRLLLTTDAMAGAGAPAGDYTLGRQQVSVSEEGRACLADGKTLAGSTLTPFAGVCRAVAMSGLPWREIWEAFSNRPRRWLGLPLVEMRVGQEAHFCVVEEREDGLRLAATYWLGNKSGG